MSNKDGWVGIDLDGTLAEYYGWVAPDVIGDPIMPMVKRVTQLLEMGVDVRIFTARGSINDEDRSIAYPAIERWCLKHIGMVLPITNVKDIKCLLIYDDRAVQVERNTGVLLGSVEKVMAPIKSKGK
jgi:hypothetical protein